MTVAMSALAAQTKDQAVAPRLELGKTDKEDNSAVPSAETRALMSKHLSVST